MEETKLINVVSGDTWLGIVRVKACDDADALASAHFGRECVAFPAEEDSIKLLRLFGAKVLNLSQKSPN